MKYFAASTLMEYETPAELINGIGDISANVYVHPEAREEYKRLMQVGVGSGLPDLGKFQSF